MRRRASRHHEHVQFVRKLTLKVRGDVEIRRIPDKRVQPADDEISVIRLPAARGARPYQATSVPLTTPRRMCRS